MLFRSLAFLSLLGLIVSPEVLFSEELPPAATAKIDFEKQVLPLLESKCFDCHGEFAQESKLRLDRKATMLRGGDSGEPAIMIGNSAESHLIKLVAGLEADLVMPPDADERLTDAQIGVLRAWIDQGANWPGPHGIVKVEKLTSDHWSFQPVEKIEPPVINDPWIRNGIDAFVLRKLNEKELTHNPPANRRTLIRRLSLDVLGLPPSPADVEEFVSDRSPDAYSQLVERMLASPHYGERWARYWLDLVRFAETYGFETNRERPHAWRYRDYVIRAFNEDRPYDQFIREQIAGDQLGNSIATSYLVAGPYDLVKSPDINLTLMQRQNELDDILGTTSTAFLGLTVACARCHNHKFDPISQTDYYALQAIFAGVNHGDRALPLPPETEQQHKQLDAQIVSLQKQLQPYLQTPTTGEFVLLDDDPKLNPAQVEHLQPIAGEGNNPAGTERGFQNDPGNDNRAANVSRGSYTWWKQQPDEPVIEWKPQVAGNFRIWLSWGCGWETHTTTARYVIDRDGDPDTQADWEPLASVNQQRFANEKPDGPLAKQSLWSGFLNAGTRTLEMDDTILLVGGDDGTVITADAILFESVIQESSTETAATPRFRPHVNAKHNIETLAPISAQFVRFTALATNGGEPCIDELQVFAEGTNVALASTGTTATASSSLPGYPIHKLAHINDGKFGNSHSWISHENGGGWVRLEFSQPHAINRIEWGRDREGRFGDRLATEYWIEVSLDGEIWKTVASSDDRLPFNASGPKSPAYRFEHLPDEHAKAGRELLESLNQTRAERTRLSAPQMAYAGQFSQPGPTHRLYRGEPLAKREQVAPDAPALFTRLKLSPESPEHERRLALANWIASPDNPLTARVIVNRIWQGHFGKGLVATPSDFGAGGVPPTHPELLDWLAGELIQHGWSLKQIHRLILNSATYRQAGTPNEAALKIDGGTQFWWRFPPRRLAAEPIRDSILSVSGVLNLESAGPGFSAFEVEPENVRHYHPKTEYGPGDWRRMIYMTKVRMEQDSVFGIFDCPDAATSVATRSRSTTPLQALNLYNSQFVLQQAMLFAARLEAAYSADIPTQVRLAYELCYARSATQEELADATQFIQQAGLTAFCRAILNSNEFLFLQ